MNPNPQQMQCGFIWRTFAIHYSLCVFPIASQVFLSQATMLAAFFFGPL